MAVLASSIIDEVRGILPNRVGKSSGNVTSLPMSSNLFLPMLAARSLALALTVMPSILNGFCSISFIGLSQNRFAWYPKGSIYLKWKKRGYQTHRLSRYRGSSMPTYRINNAEPTLWWIYRIVYFTPIGAGHCSLRKVLNLLDSIAADERRFSVFLIMSVSQRCAIDRPLWVDSHLLTRHTGSAGWRCKYTYFFDADAQKR